jgi:hypothetical protein
MDTKLVGLDSRIGDDCYSAWLAWLALPNCEEFDGKRYWKWPLDLRRDGYSASYRLVQPARRGLWEPVAA